jgi:hypothetical protein
VRVEPPIRDTAPLQLTLGLTSPWTVRRADFDAEVHRLDCAGSTARSPWSDRRHQQPGAGRQVQGQRLPVDPQPQGNGLRPGRQVRPAAARANTFLPTPNSEEPDEKMPDPNAPRSQLGCTSGPSPRSRRRFRQAVTLGIALGKNRSTGNTLD